MLKYGKSVQKVRISSVYTAMKKQWYFDRFCGKQIAAYAEDGKLVEVAVEDEADGNILGNDFTCLSNTSILKISTLFLK